MIHKTKAKERSHLFHTIGLYSHRGIAPAAPRKNKNNVALEKRFFLQNKNKLSLTFTIKITFNGESKIYEHFVGEVCKNIIHVTQPNKAFPVCDVIFS